MNVDAAQDGASPAADCPLSRTSAVPRVVLKACLRCWRRLAILLGAAALAVGVVGLSSWRGAPQEVTLELNEVTAFHLLPSFIAELRHGSARVHVLQLALAVEMPASQQSRLEEQQKAVEEAIKARLRHFDRRELEGNAGAERLRNEVLAIVNDTIAPVRASRVLYQQFVLD